jgi:SAM-dependent methyltransferase
MIKESLWMIRRLLKQYSPLTLVKNLSKEIDGWQSFWKDYRVYYCSVDGNQKGDLIKNLYPCIYDKTSITPMEPVYFYQDTWAFERILKQKPSLHIDIGSHHTFVAFLSKVIPLTMVDIRPLDLPLDTLKFQEGSILDLPFKSESVESISSLCVVEHIGLGRYGDPLDPDGSEKAISELKRVLKSAGNLYISLPLDNENKTYFNAHRAFSEDYLLNLFCPLEIIDKRYIYGSQFLDQSGKGFGIGLYHLRKPEASL